jgi:hypothetical protein
MTYDLIALCERPPDTGTTLAAMHACGPDLRVNTVQRGALVQLCTGDGDPLVTIEGARLVQVPGEAQRLLGIDEDLPCPLWWVEVRATGLAEAPRIARRFAAALLSATGGVSWSGRPTAAVS